MATKLKNKVVRLSRDTVFKAGKVREIVVKLEPPTLICYRAAGCCRWTKHTVRQGYDLAAKLEAEAIRKARLEQRKQKQKARCKGDRHGHRKIPTSGR